MEPQLKVEDYKHLLLRERVMSHQHRLNYERLKALIARIQLKREVAENRNGNATEDELVKKYIAENESSVDASLVKSKIGPNDKEVNWKASSAQDADKKKCTVAVSNTETQQSNAKTDLGKLRREMETLKKKNDKHRVELAFYSKTRGLRDDAASATLPRMNKPSTSESADKILLKESDCHLGSNYWKSQYAIVRHEYKAYKNFAETEMANMVQQLNEEAKAETERIKEELELTNFRMNATCAELNRNKISLHRENATLREELDETRLKLEEQTVLYESLTRKMDSTTTISLPKERLLDECFKQIHVQLESQKAAAESKAKFCKSEMEELLATNNSLMEEMEKLKANHEEEVRQMKALLICIYNHHVGEKSLLQSKYKDASVVVNSQQMYAEEMDGFIKARDNENLLIIDEVCKNVKTVIVDGKMALEVIEKKLRDTVSEKEKLEAELSQTITFLEDIKRESEKHKKFSDKFMKKFYEIIGGDFLGVDVLASDTDINGNGDPNRTIRERISQRQREERNLERAIRRLVLWKNESENKSKLFENRIEELEKTLGYEKSRYIDQSEMLKKKCKTYSRLVKSMRKKNKKNRSTRKVAVRRHRSPSVKSDLNSFNEGPPPKLELIHISEARQTDDNANIDDLREKHLYFGKILNTVAPSTEQELD